MSMKYLKAHLIATAVLQMTRVIDVLLHDTQGPDV